MIAAVEGILASKGNNSVIIKAGAVSFLISVPGSTLSRLGHPGNTVFLHTHLHVREDNISLYGFSSPQELSLFEQLITVSGIGPKVALALLTTLSAEQIVSAIMGSNADLLSQVPGIGKKTAGRIILDLKGKLEKGWEGEIIPAISQGDSDAVAALTGLGYSIREATQALSSIPQTDDMTLEEKVRQALQRLSSK
ncbi:MAG: Holliday junction branch migration protein RuvA [Chloroflexi bacterium]|nr:Holliday junction branch migration protein RuvA [Chloroflexota bacterium]